MTLEHQLTKHFGLVNPQCKLLNTPTHDIVAVTTPSGKLALKLYNVRSVRDVQWELDLIEHLLEHGAPVVKPVRGMHGYVLGERLKQLIANPDLDQGICHMDLTLDNVHREGDTLTVFDFDSSGYCWRALEPHGVLRFSEAYFQDWLEGYRSIRSFSKADERAVAAFGIIGNLRVTAWKLGVAKSSRRKPLLTAQDMPKVVDEWLRWEREKILATRVHS